MTKEEMQKEMERIKKQQQQLDFIDKLYDMVEHYVNKRSKTSYVVSLEENLKFDRIYNMIVYISKKL